MNTDKNQINNQNNIKNTVIGYIRVSTSNQFIENQKYEILEYCRKKSLAVTNWLELSISSRKSLKERKIDSLLSSLGRNGVLITTEISRLGRSTSEVLTIVENLLKHGHTVIFTKKNLTLRGENDFTSKILLTVFSMLAELERDLISLRTREALASRKKNGKILGKPRGSIQSSIYDKHKPAIIDCLKKGMNLTNISLFLQVGKARSLQNYVRSRKLKNKSIN